MTIAAFLPAIRDKQKLFLSFIFTLCIFSNTLFADMNILVVGSTHSYSDTNEFGVIPEKPFNPANISRELALILSNDRELGQGVNVVFDDIFKTKDLKVRYSKGSTLDFVSHCYSLAQHFMWPEGKEERLANLRGELDIAWDYVVIMADPYILANFPGMYAEGIKLLTAEIKKGTAEAILLAQWPEPNSSFSAGDFNEVVYRIADTANLRVAPAGKAWDSLVAKDSSMDHPTPNGAYLAAASIYSTLFTQSASASNYTYDDSLANHAYDVIQSNLNEAQYDGVYADITTFQMKYVKKRTLSYLETGTSTENGIAGAITRSVNAFGVNYDNNVSHWDFNYGRGNDWWEDNKDYEVNPEKYDRSYGFPMHHYGIPSANKTLPYGIDKHYYNNGYSLQYEDGTDLGIAYNMIRPGTRELGLPLDVRAIPIRLMWLKMREVYPELNALGDPTHMGRHLDDATAAFMITLLTGRCPIIDEPAERGSTAWLQWLGHKIGYETAWQMSHLSTRAPGFKVSPSSWKIKTVSPNRSETLSVRFMLEPNTAVNVAVSVSDLSTALVSPKTLTFTPENHDAPQKVRVIGLPGANPRETVSVNFLTESEDLINDGLSDSWEYTNQRPADEVFEIIEQSDSAINAIADEISVINLGIDTSQRNNTITTEPFNGQLTWDGNKLLYTPNPGFIGSDSFAFAVAIDGKIHRGHITIKVEESASNQPPLVDAGEDQNIKLVYQPSWTPAALDTVLWVDASDEDTLLTENDKVLQWQDKSGKGNHLLQEDLPLQPSTRGSSINGLSAVDFTDSNMKTLTNPFGQVINDAYVIVVHRVDSVNEGILFSLSGSEASRWNAHAPWNNGRAYFDCGGTGGDKRIQKGFSVSEGEVVISSFYGSVTENLQQIFKNAQLLVEDDTGHSVATVGELAIGGLNSHLQDTTIGEVIIIDGTVAQETQQKLEGYLAHKWKLNEKLPLDHPFYFNAPGTNQAVTQLAGSVSDADNDTLSATWSLISGPSDIAINQPSTLNSMVTFQQAGSYVLALTASDATDETTDELIINVEPATVPDGPKLEAGNIANVSGKWMTVDLPQNYAEMVVVVTPVYPGTNIPVVPRVRVLSNSSFELLMQRVDDSDEPVLVDANYLAVEAGVYNQEEHGVSLEAVKYHSTINDYKGSWMGESRTYQQRYNTPVVFGQVMTYNDSRWSAFWSRGTRATTPADGNALYTGFHIGEDPEKDRMSEEIGYVVIESGIYQTDNKIFGAAIGSDSIRGIDNGRFQYPIEASTVVLSPAGFDGGDGGWPVLLNTAGSVDGQITLTVDEDTLGDSERSHTTEQVNYFYMR